MMKRNSKKKKKRKLLYMYSSFFYFILNGNKSQGKKDSTKPKCKRKQVEFRIVIMKYKKKLLQRN